ncbi:hypothetical protein C7S14_1536 [Burkholderia cepacia]|nr:hypothetical protein C7S14_1536 [Burkholderia cepacia]
MRAAGTQGRHGRRRRSRFREKRNSARSAIFFDLYNAILALRMIERMPYVIPTAPDA